MGTALANELGEKSKELGISPRFPASLHSPLMRSQTKHFRFRSDPQFPS